MGILEKLKRIAFRPFDRGDLSSDGERRVENADAGASTINANVPEPFFQTLKRHWDTVVERVAAFVDTLGHRAQP